MRRTEIEVGKEYLTRDVKINGLFGPRFTRGRVRVTGKQRSGDWFEVKWLNQDDTRRPDPGLPKYLSPRRFLVKVG